MRRKTDFQNQPRLIRAYRWLRHRPIFALLASWQIVIWSWRTWEDEVFAGWSWWQKCGFLWTHNKSLAHFRMGDSLPLSDLIEDLKCSSN